MIIILLLIHKGKRSLQVMNEEEWVDINTLERMIRYNHDSLEDYTNDRDGSFEDYLMKP